MKNIQIYITLLVLSITVSSCFKDKIDLDLNEGNNKKLVIVAWFTTYDETQAVQLSYTHDYFQGAAEDVVEDALVTLSYDNQTITLTDQGNGYHTMPEDWRAEDGKTYELKVVHDESEYSAISTVRPIPEIRNIEGVAYEEDSSEYYDVFFEFTDTPGEGDGYFAIDYKKGSFQKNIIRTGGWISDEFLDGITFKELTVTSNRHEKGDTILLELHSIGHEATAYLDGIATEIYREGLFDPPPVNVKTNFTNGALGYFITSSAEKHQLVMGQ